MRACRNPLAPWSVRLDLRLLRRLSTAQVNQENPFDQCPQGWKADLGTKAARDGMSSRGAGVDRRRENHVSLNQRTQLVR